MSLLPSIRRKSFTVKHGNKLIRPIFYKNERNFFSKSIRVASIESYPSLPQRPPSSVPPSILFPPYGRTGRVPNLTIDRPIIHPPKSIESIRRAGRRARSVLDAILSSGKLISPGVTTDNIDEAVFRLITDPEGRTDVGPCYPSPLNYCGFPKSVCTSINEVVCHGIPDSRPLEYGDVLSVDISLYTKEGVHGDNCGTVVVTGEAGDDHDEAGDDHLGQVEKDNLESGRRLTKAAYECLMAGIAECKPGAYLTSVGSAIEDVSDSYGYGSVRKYCGHGIGSEFHCPPFVKHYRNNDAVELRPGMIFTIEPMITEGSYETQLWNDDWTVSTVDGGRSAQFEHTVLITNDGVEILTVPEELDGNTESV